MSSLRRKACRACAKSKRRCDGIMPSCGRCASHSRQCQYPFRTAPYTLSTLGDSRTSMEATVNVSGTQYIAPSSEVDGIASGMPANIEATIGSCALSDLASNMTVTAAWDTMGDDAQLQDWNHPSGDSLLSTNESQDAVTGGVDVMDPLPCPTPGSASAGFDRSSRHDEQVDMAEYRLKSTHEDSPQSPSYTELLLSPTLPRYRRTKNWTLYANTLVSNVTSFAVTATTLFINHPRLDAPHPRPSQLASPLSKALGVCAAFTTLRDADPPFFEQMLESEVDNLTCCLDPLDQTQISNLSGLIKVFRENLARMQAMVLYQIMGLFSPSPGRRRAAERQEPLVLSWTRELQLNLQALELQSRIIQAPLKPVHRQGQDTYSLTREEIESAYRTILTSYIARAVYAAVAYRVARHCDILKKLPVVVSPSPTDDYGPLRQEISYHLDDKGSGSCKVYTMMYNDFAEAGVRQSWDSDNSDPFHVLLVAVCKGSTA